MTDRTDSTAPYSGNEPYLFASYARDDRGRVQPMLARLHDEGVRLWWDDGLQAGQNFADEIERRVHESSGVVVFLSANSIARKSQSWVYEETRLAADRGKDVIPVRLDDSSLPLGWNTLVGNRQMVQASGKGQSERAIEELCGRATALGCRRSGATGATSMTSNRSATSQQHLIITVLCVVVAVLLTVVLLRPDAPRDGMSGPQGTDSARDAEAVRGSRSGEPARGAPSAPPSVSGESGSKGSAPQTPPGYADSIKGVVRSWTWSVQSALNSNELTLHWENCQGVEKMKDANKRTETGTLSDIAGRQGMAVRCCRFCYEIEFYRRMKKGEIPAPSGAAAQ